jgi:hypothetical protein
MLREIADAIEACCPGPEHEPVSTSNPAAHSVAGDTHD